MNEKFEPVIIGFNCNWCSYRAADLAGTARVKYPPNVRLIRLMCSGRMDPTFVLQALSKGADGVLITGKSPRWVGVPSRRQARISCFGTCQRGFAFMRMSTPLRMVGSSRRSPRKRRQRTETAVLVGTASYFPFCWGM